jgi:hypothetical protein
MWVGFILKKSDKMVQGKRVFCFYSIVDSKFTSIPSNLKVPAYSVSTEVLRDLWGIP